MSLRWLAGLRVCSVGASPSSEDQWGMSQRIKAVSDQKVLCVELECHLCSKHYGEPLKTLSREVS
jgi:hypothetical protein